MPNPKPNTSGLIPLKPGQTLNPGGRPVAARTRLTTHFLYELAAHFEEHGKLAIAVCALKHPDKYLTVVASLLPKEIEIKRPLDGFTDDELTAIAERIRSQVSAPEGGGGDRSKEELERLN